MRVTIWNSIHDIVYLHHKFQVWERDPESGRDVLVVDYDPLEIANDYTLHQLLGQLSKNPARLAQEMQGAWSTLRYLAEWSLYLFLEALKIFIEVLL